MLAPIVSALTKTSPGPGCGVGTSQYSRTDGPPVRRKRMAFIGASESAFPKRINCPQQIVRAEPSATRKRYVWRKKRLALSQKSFRCVCGFRLCQARILSIEFGNWHSECG